MKLAKYIEQIMNKSELNRSTLAKELNVGYHTFSAWLYGSRVPNIYQIIDIIEVFARLTNTTPNTQQRRILNAIREDKEQKGR